MVLIRHAYALRKVAQSSLLKLVKTAKKCDSQTWLLNANRFAYVTVFGLFTVTFSNLVTFTIRVGCSFFYCFFLILKLLFSVR